MKIDSIQHSYASGKNFLNSIKDNKMEYALNNCPDSYNDIVDAFVLAMREGHIILMHCFRKRLSDEYKLFDYENLANNPHIVEYLIRNNLIKNSENNIPYQGCNYKVYTAKSIFISAVEKSRVDIVDYLLSNEYLLLYPEVEEAIPVILNNMKDISLDVICCCLNHFFNIYEVKVSNVDALVEEQDDIHCKVEEITVLIDEINDKLEKVENKFELTTAFTEFVNSPDDVENICKKNYLVRFIEALEIEDNDLNLILDALSEDLEDLESEKYDREASFNGMNDTIAIAEGSCVDYKNELKDIMTALISAVIKIGRSDIYNVLTTMYYKKFDDCKEYDDDDYFYYLMRSEKYKNNEYFSSTQKINIHSKFPFDAFNYKFKDNRVGNNVVSTSIFHASLASGSIDALDLIFPHNNDDFYLKLIHPEHIPEQDSLTNGAFVRPIAINNLGSSGFNDLLVANKIDSFLSYLTNNRRELLDAAINACKKGYLFSIRRIPREAITYKLLCGLLLVAAENGHTDIIRYLIGEINKHPVLLQDKSHSLLESWLLDNMKDSLGVSQAIFYIDNIDNEYIDNISDLMRRIKTGNPDISLVLSFAIVKSANTGHLDTLEYLLSLGKFENVDTNQIHIDYYNYSSDIVHEDDNPNRIFPWRKGSIETNEIAMNMLCEKGNTAIVESLLSNKIKSVDLSMLCAASKAGNTYLFKFLLKIIKTCSQESLKTIAYSIGKKTSAYTYEILGESPYDYELNSHLSCLLKKSILCNNAALVIFFLEKGAVLDEEAEGYIIAPEYEIEDDIVYLIKNWNDF